MISVLILDGFSDDTSTVNDIALTDISNIYIPILTAMLRFNGVYCSIMKLKGLEYEYSINGKNHDNLIYVPIFNKFDGDKSNLSFIYTDSTLHNSVSFRIASDLRRKREENFEKIVFVNQLHEKDDLKRFSPIIVDDIKISNAESSLNQVYKNAEITARSITDYYSMQFKNFNI